MIETWFRLLDEWGATIFNSESLADVFEYIQKQHYKVVDVTRKDTEDNEVQYDIMVQ